MTEQELEDLKKDVGIIGIYSRRVKLKRAGDTWIALCPLHNEKSPSFKLKKFDGTILFHCFGCSEKGDIFEFVQKMDNVDFQGSVDIVRKELGKEFKQAFSATKRAQQVFKPFASDDKPTVTYTLEEYSKLEKALDESEEGKAWLVSRGITYETAKLAHVGFRLDVSSLAGKENKDISDKGWIAFPSIQNGVVSAIKYRSIIRKEYTKQSGMSKGENTPLFPDDLVDPFEPVLLSEGECFKGDVEILTPDGWVRLDKYTGQKVAQYNLDGTAEYVSPLAYISKHYEGNLIHYSSKTKSINHCSTPNHRILFKNEVTDKTEIRLAKDVPLGRSKFIRTAELKTSGVSFSDIEIRLQVMIQADATVESYSTHKGTKDDWRIEFSKDRKIQRCKNLLKEANISYSEYITGRKTTVFRFSTDVNRVKKIFPSYLYNMNRHQRDIFLDEIPHWDGHDYPEQSIVYGSVIESNADLVQWAFCMSDKAAKKGVQKRSENINENKVDLYSIYWYRRLKRGEQKYTSGGGVSRNIYPYTGQVYCVQVPSSFIIIRTEGTVHISGNCDALVLLQAGFQAKSVQSSSNSLTSYNKEVLLEAEYIVLAGDNDSTGEEYMNKAWSEIQERTFKLKWPDNLKDANDVFLIKCKGNITEFQTLVKELINTARATPIPGVCDLKESLLYGQRTDLEDNPFRLRFPWKSMDSMANILPGAVVYLSSTNTGMGKTSIIMNASIDAALHGEVVLNYSCELDSSEFGQIVVAHLCKKDRNSLVPKDYERAYNTLKDTRYYLAHDPDLNTANQVLDVMEAGIRRLGAGLVILDHFHHVTLNEKDTIKAQENAMQRIKNMARKYRVKWVNLGQPRKAKQETKGKATHLTDVKGSESIVSCSDVAFALHRELAEVDNPSKPPKEPYEPLCKIYLQKGRSQGKGNAYTELMFNGSTCSFYEVDNFTEERIL